jgi:hypothetical protein
VKAGMNVRAIKILDKFKAKTKSSPITLSKPNIATSIKLINIDARIKNNVNHQNSDLGALPLIEP